MHFFLFFSTFLNFKVFLCPVNGCYVTRIFEFVGHNNDISIFNWFQAFKSKLLHLWSLCFAICIIISQEQCCYIAPKTMLTVNYFKTFKDFKGFKWPIVNTKLRFQSTFFFIKNRILNLIIFLKKILKENIPEIAHDSFYFS